jgi:hypothetical protein
VEAERAASTPPVAANHWATSSIITITNGALARFTTRIDLTGDNHGNLGHSRGVADPHPSLRPVASPLVGRAPDSVSGIPECFRAQYVAW